MSFRFSIASTLASMRSTWLSATKIDAVHALQDQLAAGVVEDLAGHGVEVEAGLEAAHRAELEGQEVEEERAVGLGGEGDELALRAAALLLS